MVKWLSQGYINRMLAGLKWKSYLWNKISVILLSWNILAISAYINFHIFLSQYYFFISFLLFTAKLFWEGIKIWSPFPSFIFCHFQHLRSPVGHHFSKSNTFLFSFMLTSQQQTGDTFIYTFLLERFSSPELQDIVFARLSSHFSKPLCLLPWLLFCSTCRCWRTPRFCSAT